MGDHNGSQVALILINSLLFATATVLVHLWAFPQHAGGIFKNEYRNLTLAYEIPVTPELWTIVMWSITLGALLICKIYTWVLLCRKNPVGPSYKSPPIIGAWFLFTYTLALFFVICWTIVWDRNLPIAATVISFLAAFFCWLATAALYKNVHAHGAWMARHTKTDLWMYRILWHNSMAAFTTWLTIVAAYMLGITLRVEAGLGLQDIVYVVLGILGGIMLVWFILENTVLDRYGRYTVTPYLVMIFHMTGVYVRQYGVTTKETDYFIAVMLGVSAFFAVLRIALAIGRAIRCPLYSNNKVGEDPVISYDEE